MKENLFETVVGAAVVAVAAIFFFFAFSNADVRATGGYEISAKFDRVDGLAPGADVRMAGIKIGSVGALELDPKTFFAKAVFNIDDEVQIPDDSSAKVASEGLLGGSYVSIEPGGGLDNLAPGGEIIHTQGAVDLMGLIGQAVFSAGGAGEE